MSVIAWDGKTLAADKQATASGLKRTSRKIFRVGEDLLAFTGDASGSMELLEWD